jgi:tetratricopeptide (TPR) repeat protein
LNLLLRKGIVLDRRDIDKISSGRDAYIGNTIYARTGAPTPTITSLYQLRAPVADFVGRNAEIRQLVRAISKITKRGKVAIGGILGMGGMGKTELAYAVAQRLKPSFPDAQLFLELQGTSDHPVTPEQALQTIIRTFEPTAPLPDNLAGLRSTYLTLFDSKRVLILADDALDKRQLEPLLPPPGCALLLTSRQRFNWQGMERLDLEMLSQLEAEKLLLKICPAIGPATTSMTQLCGRLPLALRLCASACANSTRSIEYHLAALENERERLTHLRDLDVRNPDDPATSVEASLLLSYATLTSQAQGVLCQLSVFPSTFDMKAAIAVVQASGAEEQGTNAKHQSKSVEELLELLYHQSLVEWDGDRETGRYSLHDLVRMFGVERIKGGEYAARLRHAHYYAMIADQADDLYMKGGDNLLLGLKLFDEERANIDAGWNWARQQAESTSQEINDLLLGYAGATSNVGDLRYDKRRERIPQLEAAIEAARRLSNRQAEGSILGSLGVAYAALGEIRKAIQYFEQHLKIAHQIGDRLNEGMALDNMGNAYAALGEIRKAIQYYEQRLEIAHQIGDRLNEGMALDNIGNAYTLLREPHKALQYYEQVLEIARQMGDQRGEGSTLGNMGNAYAALGEIRKAIQYYEQRLEIARLIGHREGEATTSWNLGAILAEKGDLARAVELMQVTVDYEREIGHTNAEEDAAALEELRKRLT